MPIPDNVDSHSRSISRRDYNVRRHTSSIRPAAKLDACGELCGRSTVRETSFGIELVAREENTVPWTWLRRAPGLEGSGVSRRRCWERR